MYNGHIERELSEGTGEIAYIGLLRVYFPFCKAAPCLFKSTMTKRLDWKHLFVTILSQNGCYERSVKHCVPTLNLIRISLTATLKRRYFSEKD